MKPVLRLIDADPDVLEARVQRAVATLAADRPCVVDRFTHWYTTRPPAYEAVLLVA